MTRIASINDVYIKDRRLVVRADLNVPVQGGKIADRTRIDRFCKGMRPLLNKGAKLVVLTHRGRPENGFDLSLSNDVLREALSDGLEATVGFSSHPSGVASEALSNRLMPGQVLLCENVRFLKGEIENDMDVAKGFAQLGDYYVNDAFSTAHRAHASTVGVTQFMPSFAGPLMLEEIEALTRTLETPKRPAVAIVGGAKVSSKIGVLKNLVGKLDKLIVGGGMANTFLFADGAPMGKSLHEPDQMETVAEVRALAQKSGCEILLPHDVVVAQNFASGAASHIVSSDACPDGWMILDAGPNSVARFKTALSAAETILWNGPLGAFEMPPFDKATVDLAEEAARLTREGRTVSVAGGGDTVAALNAANVSETFTYVSTAGGAFLEWLEGKSLPGVTALLNETQAA
jgi:phosphoglycerate kinase